TFWLKKTVRIIGVDAVKIGTVVIAKVADVIIFGAHKIVGAKTVYARNFIKAKGTFVTEFCFAVHHETAFGSSEILVRIVLVPDVEKQGGNICISETAVTRHIRVYQ